MKKLIVVFSVFCLVLVGCGGGDLEVIDEFYDYDFPDHVTIEGVDYPLHPEAVPNRSVGTFRVYIIDGEAEAVFDWYTTEMAAEGWGISLDGSNGKTGQRTFHRGDTSDKPSLEFVIVNVFEQEDMAALNIAPQPNRYRK
ncbi:hypothetical protein HOG48_06425 [Candidatus Peregrinibacteria bacterium]|jgi:hypothetical protein|nr:hypothetical protein [Candidatus Peregrinibacteria bacterium]